MLALHAVRDVTNHPFSLDLDHWIVVMLPPSALMWRLTAQTHLAYLTRPLNTRTSML